MSSCYRRKMVHSYVRNRAHVQKIVIALNNPNGGSYRQWNSGRFHNPRRDLGGPLSTGFDSVRYYRRCVVGCGRVDSAPSRQKEKNGKSDVTGIFVKPKIDRENARNKRSLSIHSDASGREECSKRTRGSLFTATVGAVLLFRRNRWKTEIISNRGIFVFF